MHLRSWAQLHSPVLGADICLAAMVDTMSAQMVTVVLQIAAGCVWLLMLASVSSANEMSAKRSVPSEGAFAIDPLHAHAHAQPAHSV
jgi:hypothetical protein